MQTHILIRSSPHSSQNQPQQEGIEQVGEQYFIEKDADK